MSKGLGKGLSALISENQPVNSEPEQTNDNRAYTKNTLPLDDLIPGKFQPRTFFDEEELTELSESIKKNGIVQPIIVRPTDANAYEIIAGERRWRASKMAGLTAIPVVVMNLDDKQAMEISLVENIQRRDLSPLEVAGGYRRLIEEFNYTQENLSTVIGKSRSQIANSLRLLVLPEEIKTLLNEEKLSAGHARALLNARDPRKMAQTIIKRDLNVRQAEKLVQKETTDGNKTIKISLEKDPDIIRLEQLMSERLGMKISVENKGSEGKIIINYSSLGELDTIVRKLEA